MPKKILFINQEVTPYVPETPMSLLGRQLPQTFQERGNEIRTFMPKWGGVNERRGQLHEVIRLSGMNLIINDTDHPLIIKVASIQQTRVQVYFIDNDDYFSKHMPSVEERANDEYPEGGERAVFFARGVLETVKKLRWVPDIIHCQGWMTSVVPYYVKTAYREEPSFAQAKVVTSLFADSPKKDLGESFPTSLDFREAKQAVLQNYAAPFGGDELLRLAVDYSDAVALAQPDVDESLTGYVKEKGLPMMEYPGEDFANAYDEFYKQICPDAQ